MPRLGIDGNNDEPLRSGSRGNPAAAYPPNARARSMWSMLLILFFTLVLRNLFFRVSVMFESWEDGCKL